MGSLFGMIGCSAGREQQAEEMGRVLAHRGANPPWIAAFGKRGETLLGSDSPSQPWHRGTLSLVGDLDIYNAADLAKEFGLSEEGASECPGQVVLSLLERWGEGVLARLNGEFAFAVHDASDGSVLLARDLAGARPLYYARWQGATVVASEYKALVALPGFPRRVDRNALQILQIRKHLPADRTLLLDVRQLAGGSWMRLRPGSSLVPVRYWNVSLDLRRRSFADHCAEVRDAFLRAMDRRMPTGEPIGIALSGGVDSISMVAAARKLRPKEVIHTFSAGDASDDPELKWAGRVAEHFGTQHEALVVESDHLGSDLPQLVWHLEDPIARTETLMAYLLARAARGTVSRILGGYAADGIFGGMPRHRIVALAGYLPFGFGRRSLGEIYLFSQTGIRSRARFARLAARLYFGGGLPPAPRVIGAQVPEPQPGFPTAGRETLNEFLRFGTIHGLPEWLQKVERSHAAAGLSFSSPYIDPDLIRTAFTIPTRYKHTIRRSKVVLRNAMCDLLPREFAERPKHPQRIRETRRFCDALAELAGRYLEPARVEERGLLAPADVACLLQRPQSGLWTPEHAMRIWTLLITELWARLFLDAEMVGAPPLAAA